MVAKTVTVIIMHPPLHASLHVQWGESHKAAGGFYRPPNTLPSVPSAWRLLGRRLPRRGRGAFTAHFESVASSQKISVILA